MQLKICDSRLTCNVANKCLYVCERMEVVEREKKMVPSLPLLSCESSVSVKENCDRRKKLIYRTLLDDCFCWFLCSNQGFIKVALMMEFLKALLYILIISLESSVIMLSMPSVTGSRLFVTVRVWPTRHSGHG